jgi:hypothetical protein
MSTTDKFNLEQMIDTHGLASVLETISTICAEKADHIRANYDDRTLARAWQTTANRIERCADAVTV